MTAMAVAQDSAGDVDAAELWAVIEEEFLATLGWDPERRVLFFPEHHPVMGWASCAVSGCRKEVRSSIGLCCSCAVRWRKAGRGPLPEFLVQAKPNERSIGYRSCLVSGCERPWRSRLRPLCGAHDRQQQEVLRLPLEEFLTHPQVVGYRSFGPCAVAACTRDRIGHGQHCDGHQHAARKCARDNPAFDLERWRRTAPAIAQDNQVSLRGLGSRAVAEILYGLQERVRTGSKTRHLHLRPYCDMSAPHGSGRWQTCRRTR